MVVHYRGLPPTALYLASACLTRPVTKGCVNASCFACQCIWFHSQHACQCISRSKFTHPLLHGFQWWRLLIVTLKWNWFSNITEPYPQNNFNKQWPQNRDKCSLHRYDRSLWRMLHLRFTPVSPLQWSQPTRGCFTKVSQALQNILSKFVGEIVLLMRILSSSLTHFGHMYMYKHQLEIYHKCDFWQMYIFARSFWRARDILVKQPCDLWVVSLMRYELSKIISRKYTKPEITFIVIISSWNFVRMSLGTRTKFQLEIITKITISAINNFSREYFKRLTKC